MAMPSLTTCHSRIRYSNTSTSRLWRWAAHAWATCWTFRGDMGSTRCASQPAHIPSGLHQVEHRWCPVPSETGAEWQFSGGRAISSSGEAYVAVGSALSSLHSPQSNPSHNSTMCVRCVWLAIGRVGAQEAIWHTIGSSQGVEFPDRKPFRLSIGSAGLKLASASIERQIAAILL